MKVLQGERTSVFSWFSDELQASSIIYIAITHTEVRGIWRMFSVKLKKGQVKTFKHWS